LKLRLKDVASVSWMAETQLDLCVSVFHIQELHHPWVNKIKKKMCQV
jgi:hypothetical protein